jgi:hypothetical protein
MRQAITSRTNQRDIGNPENDQFGQPTVGISA